MGVGCVRWLASLLAVCTLTNLQEHRRIVKQFELISGGGGGYHAGKVPRLQVWACDPLSHCTAIPGKHAVIYLDVRLRSLWRTHQHLVHAPSRSPCCSPLSTSLGSIKLNTNPLYLRTRKRYPLSTILGSIGRHLFFWTRKGTGRSTASNSRRNAATTM